MLIIQKNYLIYSELFQNFTEAYFSFEFPTGRIGPNVCIFTVVIISGISRNHEIFFAGVFIGGVRPGH